MSSPTFSSPWYYARAGQQFGPIDHPTLATLYASGQVVPSDLLWTQGMANWLPADQVLGPSATAPPPPPSYSSPYAAPGQMPLGYSAYVPQYNVLPFAGFWIRFVAVIIDALILAIPNLLLSTAIRAAAGYDLNPTVNLPLGSGAWLATNLIGVALNWLYEALMISSPYQATLGKMALGIYVVDLDGQRLSFPRATARYFAKILSGLTLLIGYVMAAFTERKQALHDMIGSTYVLRR
jgi:uncharacterized RDD family membrane protein YckC